MILGLDPGMAGGIVFISLNANIVDAHKMPDTERDIADVLRLHPVQMAFLEAVHSFPGQGVASSFKFGRNYGFLRGCLIASGIPFEDVSPQKWQKAMACLTKGDKNVSKARAQQLFPAMRMTHHIADAILIAEHGRRVWNQRQGNQLEAVLS